MMNRMPVVAAAVAVQGLIAVGSARSYAADDAGQTSRYLPEYTQSDDLKCLRTGVTGSLSALQ
jgi:hypothetical protein